MIVLIDGDILLYKAGFSIESRSYTVLWKQPPETTLCKEFKTYKEAYKFTQTGFSKECEPHSLTIQMNRYQEPFSHAAHNLRNIIRKILTNCKTKDYKIFISGDTNFRYDIAVTKPYKGNRTPDGKPLCYPELKEYLKTFYSDHIIEASGEADDALGIAATSSNDTIIATIDKDLMMIPGTNYNLDSGSITNITDPGDLWIETTTSAKKILRGYGFKWFCAQMLLGDTADHIPGIRGLGSVKTLTILGPCTNIRSMYARVIKTYRKHKVIDRIDEIRQLLWIHRSKTFEEVLGK